MLRFYLHSFLKQAGALCSELANSLLQYSSGHRLDADWFGLAKAIWQAVLQKIFRLF